jgi:hypothetical protein
MRGTRDQVFKIDYRKEVWDAPQHLLPEMKIWFLGASPSAQPREAPAADDIVVVRSSSSCSDE